MEGLSNTPAQVQVIVLDTNVVSELMTAGRDKRVVEWIERQDIEAFWLTSVTIFEIEFGLLAMPMGRKVRERTEAFRRVREDDLNDRVLPLDALSARRAAEFAATRKRAGRPVDIRDAEIAGIVSAQQCILATRNVRDFDGFALDIVNPWAT